MIELFLDIYNVWSSCTLLRCSGRLHNTITLMGDLCLYGSRKLDWYVVIKDSLCAFLKLCNFANYRKSRDIQNSRSIILYLFGIICLLCFILYHDLSCVVMLETHCPVLMSYWNKLNFYSFIVMQICSTNELTIAYIEVKGKTSLMILLEVN